MPIHPRCIVFLQETLSERDEKFGLGSLFTSFDPTTRFFRFELKCEMDSSKQEERIL